MEAAKKRGPAPTLVITSETQRKTLIHSVIFSMDWIHTPSPGLRARPALPARLLVCTAPAQRRLIEVDCGIISLIKFFHFLRLLPPVFLSNQGGGATPFLLLCPLALHIPPITADHCLNYSSLLSPPLSPSFTVAALPPSSSYLIPNCSTHSSPLALLKVRRGVAGRVFEARHSCISPSFPLSSLSVIRISQMFSDYFYLDMAISPTAPPRPAPPAPPPRAREFSFPVFIKRDWVGEYYFDPRTKRALISLFASCL